MTVFPPGYQIRRLKIVEHPGDDWKHPLFYAERVAAVVDGRELLHARLAARARLDGPKVVIINRGRKEGAKAGVPDVRRALERVTPARVTRVEVRDGEILYRDLTAPRQPEIWVHDIEAAVENMATRPGLAHGRPATLNARAKLGRSGGVDDVRLGQPFCAQAGIRGRVRPARLEGRRAVRSDRAEDGSADPGGDAGRLRRVQVGGGCDHRRASSRC